MVLLSIRSRHRRDSYTIVYTSASCAAKPLLCLPAYGTSFDQQLWRWLLLDRLSFCCPDNRIDVNLRDFFYVTINRNSIEYCCVTPLYVLFSMRLLRPHPQSFSKEEGGQAYVFYSIFMLTNQFKFQSSKQPEILNWFELYLVHVKIKLTPMR